MGIPHSPLSVARIKLHFNIPLVLLVTRLTRLPLPRPIKRMYIHSLITPITLNWLTILPRAITQKDHADTAVENHDVRQAQIFGHMNIHMTKWAKQCIRGVVPHRSTERQRDHSSGILNFLVERDVVDVS
jgi:hypothetical protein